MIKCISCIFAKVDKAASDKDWKAYQCTNPQSEYEGALLNISVDGNKLKKISWQGCPYGVKR